MPYDLILQGGRVIDPARSAMTALMACGLTLEQLVPMVTTNAARMLGLEAELGTLAPGTVADVSVLHDTRGQWTLRDNEGHEAQTQRMLRPAFCLRTGASRRCRCADFATCVDHVPLG